MKLDLLNTENKKTDVQISESTFGKEFNETLVHQAVVTYLAGSRQGSQNKRLGQKLEEEAKNHIVKKALVEQELVQLKPYMERRRSGFCSNTKRLFQKINKKMYRAAISSIFSELHSKIVW